MSYTVKKDKQINQANEGGGEAKQNNPASSRLRGQSVRYKGGLY